MVKSIGLNKIDTAVFISGNGSNLKSLIKFSKQRKSPILIQLIITDNLYAKGLNYAKHYKIKKKIIDFKNKNLAEKKIIFELKKNKIDCVCLAGFMRILSKNFIKKFNGKILNIHPSLLPKYKGLNTHQRAKLYLELSKSIECSDWFTVGIMAESENIAISTLRGVENHLNWAAMKLIETPNKDGPVYLKANQKTGNIHIRIETGLGEGILLGCHYFNDEQNVEVIGPLPLNFFHSEK